MDYKLVQNGPKQLKRSNMAQYNDLKIKIKIQDIGTDHLGFVSDFDDDLTAG